MCIAIIDHFCKCKHLHIIQYKQVLDELQRKKVYLKTTTVVSLAHTGGYTHVTALAFMRVWVCNYQIIFPASDIVAGKLWQLGKLGLRWPHLLRMCRCLIVSTCFFLLFSVNSCFYILQSQTGFFGIDASAANANIHWLSSPFPQQHRWGKGEGD